MVLALLALPVENVDADGLLPERLESLQQAYEGPWKGLTVPVQASLLTYMCVWVWACSACPVCRWYSWRVAPKVGFRPGMCIDYAFFATAPSILQRFSCGAPVPIFPAQ